MGYGNFRTGTIDGSMPTPKKIPSHAQNASRRSFVEIFDLSKANFDGDSGQSNVCFDVPAGHAPLAIKVRSSASLATSTLAFGVAGAPAKFGAAAAYGTTAEVEKEYLLTAKKGVVSTTEERWIMTIGAANLPSSGTVVVELETATHG